MKYYDARYSGHHGIARFAHEVTSRLGGEWQPLPLATSVTSPRDVVDIQRIRLRRSDFLFSPGYRGGLTAATQLLTVHDLIHLRFDAERSAIKTLYYETVVRPAIVRAGMVFTVSETSRADIQNWLNRSDVEIVNVGNGAGAEFSTVGPKNGSLEGRLLYVGGLHPHKNVRLLGEMLLLDPRLRLTIVTAQAAAAARLFAELSVPDSSYEILSGVSDSELAAMYRSCRALVFPSRMEGYGLPALEAAMCGTPVIYWSGCESVKEIVSGYSNLSVTSSSDPAEWLAAVNSVDGLPANTGDIVLHDWERVASAVRSSLDRYSNAN